METIELDYRGFVIKHSSVPKDATPYQVHVDSQNPHLLSRLLGQQMFEDRAHMERAIKKAKLYIDVALR